MMTEGKTMTNSQEFSTNGTSGDSDFNPNVDPNGREGKLPRCGNGRFLFSLFEGAVRIDFASRELDSGAWLTPTQAAELIQLLQATFVK